jgi:hypothetical protein
MLDIFNNIWVIIICVIIGLIIIRKIYNLNKPFDEEQFMEKYQNQKKLKEKFSLDILKKNIPNITHMYLGL